MEKYKVYQVDPARYYYGFGLVAADNAKEANEFIKEFKRQDENNWDNSWGWASVSEIDKIDDIFAERKGIIKFGINYGG